MKNITLTVAVLVGLLAFISCEIPKEKVKEIEKYGYSIENQTKTGHEDAGNDPDDDDEETGDK